jgi:hypothetical protein
MYNLALVLSKVTVTWRWIFLPLLTYAMLLICVALAGACVGLVNSLAVARDWKKTAATTDMIGDKLWRFIERWSVI